MTSASTALTFVLPDKRLKLSEFDDLNDPLELLSVNMTDEAVRNVTKKLREHWAQTTGVICMSENWRSPVMWAHYADKHKGMCLAFDIPTDKNIAFPIDYSGERLRVELAKIQDSEEAKCAFIKALLKTKAKEWAYEAEWRLMAELKERELPSNFAFVDFGPNLVLKEVILGCRCKYSLDDIAEKIRVSKPTADVLVYKAKPMSEEFKIIKDEDVPSINVPGFHL